MDKLTLIENMLPYLQILNEKVLPKNKSHQAAIDNLLSLRWAVQARQKNRVEVTPKGEEFIPAYLFNKWPDWQECQERLIAADLSFNFGAVIELHRQERLAEVSLPKRIHHKTLAAIVGVHSKTGVSKGLEKILSATTITTDQSLRFHAQRGMRLDLPGGGALDCDGIMTVLGEVAIPERAFLEGVSLSGTWPRAVFTVENRGSFVDFPAVDSDILVLHTPGNDLDLTKRLLTLLPVDIPCFHFGDLDPKGLQIFKGLALNVEQKVRLFVPSFWRDYYNISSSKPKLWPAEEVWLEAIPIVKTLIEDRRWLEQEKVALDPRLAQDILQALSDRSSSFSFSL